MAIDSTLLSRRKFLGNSGKIATGGALAGIALPVVHGKDDDTTKIAPERGALTTFRLHPGGTWAWSRTRHGHGVRLSSYIAHGGRV